tara:strand:+ start:3604 stop:4341 length:738 start_codon:yes stop_codon:yes gene_type:complete
MSSSDSDSEEEHSKCTKCGDDYPDNLFAYDNVCYQCVEEPNNNNNGNDDNNEIVNKLGNDLNQKAKITNRGTGAGGANTNKNGLKFERKINLRENYMIISTKNNINEIIFNGTKQKFIEVHKAKLQNYMKKNNEMNLNINIGHGCKHPDEAYINENKKLLIIIEKKFQQGTGSVCEKLQTALFKREHYGKLFPNYKIEYVYCLSNWFIKNCKAEIEFLHKNKFPVFFGKNKENINEIINFMINYN